MTQIMFTEDFQSPDLSSTYRKGDVVKIYYGPLAIYYIARGVAKEVRHVA